MDGSPQNGDEIKQKVYFRALIILTSIQACYVTRVRWSYTVLVFRQLLVPCLLLSILRSAAADTTTETANPAQVRISVCPL